MPDTTQTRISKKKPQFSSVMERLRQKRASQAPVEIERLPRDGRPLGLSSTQQRLWFIEQLHPGTATYNLGSNVVLRGSLDLPALLGAFLRVLERHESLRTRFDDRGGEPFQVIVAEARLSMPLIDLSAVALGRRELAVLVTRLRAMPFDLRRAPLFKTAVLRLSPSEHILVMSQHHIVSDGWSSAILIREAMAFYEAALVGGRPRLPTLPIQYADYAAWQRKNMDTPALAEDLEFWVRHLEGAPPVLELPGDRPRPAVQSHRGTMHLLRFSARLTEGLRSLARRSDTTLFVVLMASFQGLLQRWTGQDDFAVGIPIAHRQRAELRDLIGYFANTLALRVQARSSAAFVEHVERLQELMLEVHRHQSVPFERLVEKLQPERSLSHTPLFQVLFSFQNVPVPRLELPGLSLEPLPIGDDTAIFDLTLDLTEEAGRLGGWFDYNTDLFDPTTMNRLEVYLRNMLEGLVAAPDGAPSEVSLMSDAEHHQVLEEWNDTRWAAGDSERPAVPRLFEAAARRDPDAVAVVFADEALSYGGLNSRVDRVAHHLRELGVGPEARVGVALERSTSLVVSLLATWKAGGAYVPLDPQYPRRRLADMMGDAGLQALVTERRHLGRLRVPRGVRVVELDRGPEEERETDPPAASTGLHAAYLIFTSGSTGRPKATVVPHRGVDNRLLWIQEVYPLGKGDRVLQKTPFTFDVSVWELFWPLLSGATLVVARPGEHRDPRALSRRIERHGVTVVHFVPSMLGAFLEDAGVEQRCATLRRVFASGEALSDELARRFFRRFPLPLENLYGPTEASIEVTHWRGRPPSEQRGAPRLKVSIGRPIGNLRILLFDRVWRPVPLGVAGELAIGGVAVARVYSGRPRLTAERFVPDPFDDTDRPGTRLYRSGDLARFLSDGQIEFLGRLDHQVKVRGFRVELGEIESRLLEHPAVREAVVTPQQGEGPSVRSGAARLVAYAVATDPEAPPRLEQLRPFLKESLPEYMMPAALVVLEAMPLGPSGKLDRRGLPQPSFESASSQYVAPRTPIEEAVAGFIAEVLERSRVGLYDDFFELGGHSLLATRVVSRVQAVLDVDVALTAFFEAPTVAGIAARIEAARASGRESPPPPLVPEPRDRPLPLSFAQERMWFLDQLVPGTPFYNLPVHFSLEGPLSAAVLERVLTEVVRRHEVLRTVFSAAAGQPRQLIAAPAPVAMPVVDLAGLARAARRQAVERLSRDEAERPFDLTSDWPLRAVLLHGAAEEHALLLTLHHIASDGWSMGLLVREVMALYEAFGRGEAPPLADLRVQYADYALWQRSWLSGEVLARELAYWRSQLSDVPPVLELPGDRPRSAHPSYRGGSLPVRVERGLAGSLSRLARQEGSTLFMVLLASFQTLLFRYTGQNRVAVGIPIAGRTRVEVEDVIGLFVNTLVLCGERWGDPSFQEYLGRVRGQTLEAYRHQDLPFEKLVEEMSPERGLSHSPLFQVMLVLQNAPLQDLDLAGLRLHPLAPQIGVADLDLSLSLSEGDDGISGLLDYSADLFDRSTIERFWRHYTTLLAGLAADPEQPLSELALLGPAERAQVLREWNDHEREGPRERCLDRLFDAQAQLRPDSSAVLFGDSWLSYGELEARANQVARHLRRRGVGPEVLVGLLMERSLELPVGVWGILKAGGGYLPLDPEYPRERLELMLRDTGVEVALSLGRLKELLADGGPLELVCLDEDWGEIARESRAGLDSWTTAENLAYVIYTSGSTGRPKGVVNRHGSVSSHLTFWRRLVPPRPEPDVLIQISPISFDLSVVELCTAFLTGARLVVARPGGHRDPAYVASELVRGRVTALEAVPAMHQHLLDEPQAKAFDALRLVIGGADVVSPELVKRHYRRLKADMVNAYGPTETTIDASCFWVSRRGELPGGVPIGRAIDNGEIYLVDRRLQPAPVGVPGELLVGGGGVTRGYWNRPGLTAEKFVPHPFNRKWGSRLYRTGDLARTLSDGLIHFIGRVDRQVKVRGFRIELGEVESVMRESPKVKEAVAAVRRDPARGKVLVGYVAIEGGSEALDELQGLLQERLPDHMVPGHLMALEAFPLTPTGKVDRRSLPAPEWDRRVGADEAPRTPDEEAIAGIWREVLGLERLGVTESFFQLGGHSLLATQIVSRVRSALGVELALQALFEAPTVRGLAVEVERERLAEEAPGAPPRIDPVGRDKVLPLSFAQERLWFLDQLEPASPAYNIPGALRLRGALQSGILRRCLAEVVRRHEVLRTTFRTTAGEPEQVVGPAGEWPLPWADLSYLPERKREEVARRLADEEAVRPFDLGAGPLLRTVLLRLTEDHHVLLVNMHHIVSDGWSMGVLVREMGTLYGAYVGGEASPGPRIGLPELEVQYSDFAFWQRSWLAGHELERQLAYWRTRLAGAPPSLDLPTDRPRPPRMSSHGAHLSRVLPADLSRRLRGWSEREGATLFMTLLASFSVLLWRWTGQQDVVVGSPIANRNREEIEGLIGFFVNTLVLRTDVSDHPTLRELLYRVRRVALEAYAHQDLPFERLVEELGVARTLDRPPLFQVMLVLQNAPDVALELPGLEVSAVETAAATARFDLTLTVGEGPEELGLGVEYNVDLFDEATLQRFLRHFELLLRAQTAAPEQRVSEATCYSAAERHQLLVEWNAAAAVPAEPLGLHRLFEAQVDRTPERVALIWGEELLSYGDLERQANRLAHRLRRSGVGPWVRVGLCLGRSPEMVVGVLGILKAGGAYVPLDPTYPEERQSFMLDDSAVSVLVGSPEQERRLPSAPAEKVFLNRHGEALAGESEERPSSGAGPDDLSHVLYTSGSTGRPKGVAVRHRNAAALLAWSRELYTAEELGGVLASTSLNFDLSVFELFVPLSRGGRVILAENALVLGELPAAPEVRLINTVPSAMRELLRSETAPPGVMTVNLAGEALPETLVEEIHGRTGVDRVYNLYGPSEDTTYSTAMRIARGVGGPPPIGRPISGTQAYVLDSDHRPVAMGTVGELNLGGDGLALGYLGRPGLTAERFVPDPWSAASGERLYRTGDLARFRPAGELEFRGRIDHQVKLRGFRIELDEIASVLVRHSAVREAVVVARPQGGGTDDRRLVAYVAGGPEQPARELRGHLRRSLPEYMVPAAFVWLPALPLTVTGKIDRRALPEPERSLRGPLTMPRDEVELRLVRIWEELLGARPIGVEENFFELGGHSILAVRLMAAIERAFGVQLAVLRLFEAPSVERLAAILRKQGDEVTDGSDVLVPIQRGGERPPFFCVHPVGGGVLCYSYLALRLGSDQPFYALQSPTPASDAGDLEEMARAYLREIRRVQPVGPYFVGGWSFGGVVAFEVARQLTDEGERVGQLVLIDSFLPDALRYSGPRVEIELLESFLADLLELSSVASARVADYARALEERYREVGAGNGISADQLGSLFEQVLEAGVLPAGLTAAQLVELYRIFRHNALSLGDYTPRVFAGPATLFRAEESASSPDVDGRDWSGLMAEAPNVVSIPGNHYTILQSPHCEVLAGHLGTLLASSRKDRPMAETS